MGTIVQENSVFRTTVTGGDTYDVDIAIVERTPDSLSLEADCTCPYVDEHAAPCKHIWAALLAIENQNLVATVPEDVSLELTPLPDMPDAPAGLAETLISRFPEELRSLILGGAPRATRAPRASSKPDAPPPPPLWQRVLDEMPDRPRADVSAPSRQGTSPVAPRYLVDSVSALQANRLVIGIQFQEPRADGKPGRPKPFSLTTDSIQRLTDPNDRLVAALLLGADPQADYSYYPYRNPRSAALWSPPAASWDTLLPVLFATSRVFYGSWRAGAAMPLTWDGGPAWELTLTATVDDGVDLLDLVLCRADERAPVREVTAFIDGSPGLFLRHGALHRFNPNDCFEWLRIWKDRKPVALPGDERGRVIEHLARRQRFPALRLPAEWGYAVVDSIAPRPTLTLSKPRSPRFGFEGRDTYCTAAIHFRYDALTVVAGSPGGSAVDVGARRVIRRQRDAEAGLYERALRVGARRDKYDDTLRITQKAVPKLVSTLMAEGWTVLGEQGAFRRPGRISVLVTSGIDWFGVSGEVEFDGQTATLPEILTAARKGERFVRLGDGSLGMLPDEWLSRHGAMLELGRADAGELRFERSQVALLDALLAAMPEVRVDEQFRAARQRLASFDGIAARTESVALTGTLRLYQREGLGWLHFLREFGWGGCLADDMGLGKTIQVLGLLLDRKEEGCDRPSLVIVPRSLIFNWMNEARRFAPGLRVLDFSGVSRRDQHDAILAHDVVLATYGTFKRDIEKLCDVEFDYVVLDEAQAIKNPQSLSAKAARLLRARQRLALSGTPVENHLGDLWSIFEFLNPGMLGKSEAFRRAFRAEDERDAAAPGGDRPPSLQLLHKTLRPFILRRTKSQVATELPQRVEQTIECEMGEAQSKIYAELRDHYRALLMQKIDDVGIDKSRMHILEALLRLRQAACHPALIDPQRKDVEAAKLERLLPMLADLREEGHKVLVFSQFTSLLRLVREPLDHDRVDYEYLDGKTRDRQKRVDRFQNDPDCKLFLISLKAGGVGLNLTAADYVFILDPWWNPAVEAQAIDRTHRIGQTRTVIAYRLIARGTIEAKIQELQQSKRDLAAAIINEDNSRLSKLTREDLAVLLG
ncbi:ATP-dependent helicase HepA [Phycisphaerae bacterium RAS1]|nr:ATP-dependent helicase HepA [Phycisphaerae bacterium RAS1]